PTPFGGARAARPRTVRPTPVAKPDDSGTLHKTPLRPPPRSAARACRSLHTGTTRIPPMLGQSNGDEVKLNGDDPLRAVFIHAAVGMAVLDAEERFLHANPAFCRLTGYAPDELRRLSLRALRHPDDPADDSAHEARYVRKGGDA